MIYSEKLSKIMDLAVVNKEISPEGLEHLKTVVKSFMSENGDDLETVINFVVIYVYNEAYRAGINDSLKILTNNN